MLKGARVKLAGNRIKMCFSDVEIVEKRVLVTFSILVGVKNQTWNTLRIRDVSDVNVHKNFDLKNQAIFFLKQCLTVVLLSKG